ncbi:MAG: hypothetical protein ACSHX6_04765 [Akkermansiaceae bacterium]
MKTIIRHKTPVTSSILALAFSLTVNSLSASNDTATAKYSSEDKALHHQTSVKLAKAPNATTTGIATPKQLDATAPQQVSPVKPVFTETTPSNSYIEEAVIKESIAAIDNLLDKGYAKFQLVGTESIHSQITNLILTEHLKSKGIKGADIITTDLNDPTKTLRGFTHVINKYKKLAASTNKDSASKTCVVSTLAHQDNIILAQQFKYADYEEINCHIIKAGPSAKAELTTITSND